jgi:Ring finger domain
MSYRHLDNVQCVHTNYCFNGFAFDENSENCKMPNDGAECDFCGDLLSDQQCVILNSCKHVFHEKCYTEYVNFKLQEGNPATCPQCRAVPENVWNLAFGAVQHASIHRPVLPMRIGYGNNARRDKYIKQFLTELCKHEDFTFASRSRNDNQIYQDRYNLLVHRVYNELLIIQSDEALSQSLELDRVSLRSLNDYTHHIIKAFKSLQRSYTSLKYQTVNSYFEEGSAIYEQYLHYISDGNPWPIPFYGHMQKIHEIFPEMVPNIRTIGIDPTYLYPPEQPNNIDVPVVDKNATAKCIQLLLQAFNNTHYIPVSSGTRSHDTQQLI